MAVVDGPVCLTHSAPIDMYAGQLLFYDVVPSRAVSRSGFLSSIVDAGGDARLPDFVTLSEFRAWIGTFTVQTSRPNDSDLDIAQACTVLKAADALDDDHYTEWLDLTVRLLRQHAFAHFRSRGRTKTSEVQQISAGLSALPDHLKHRVFEAVTHCREALQPDEQSYLGMLLDLLPTHLHAAVVATAITPQKSLSIPPSVYPLPFIASLAHLPASPPSLLSLHLHCTGPYIPKDGGLRSGSTPPSRAAAALAEALRHHSALTSLRFDTFTSKATISHIAPAIATLTSLLSLRLDHNVDVDALPDLRGAFRPLSSLQHLHLGIQESTKLPRYFDIGSMRPGAQPFRDEPPQNCLSSLLASLTALTSLHLKMGSSSYQYQPLTATAALALPCLSSLRINSMFDDAAPAALLSKLCAPLATLKVDAPLAGTHQQEDHPQSPQLLDSLPRFTQLQSIELVQHATPATAGAEALLLAGAASSLVPLRVLEELRIRAGLRLMHCLTQQLADSDAQLRWLELSYCIGRDFNAGLDCVWRGLLLQLGNLRHLQRLDMHIGSVSRSGTFDDLGVAALQPLQQLTALHVYGWRGCLGSEQDCAALATMRQLRSVCIDRFAVRMPAAVQAAFVRALGALPHLEQLALKPGDPTAGDVFLSVFAEHAVEGAWPALQWLGLCVVLNADTAPVVEAVVACPELQELMFGGRFVPSEHAPLQRRAARVGLRLVFGWNWERFEWGEGVTVRHDVLEAQVKDRTPS